MDNPQRPVFELRVAPAVRQRRLTVFFRYLMVIPHLIVLSALGIAAYVLTFFAWFAILFTGRNPFHRFLSNFIRWGVRVNAYLYLLTDVYPPFTLDDDAGYPVDTKLEQGSMSRLTVFFRLILAIPAVLIATFVVIGMELFGIVAWFITLIRGELPVPLHVAFAATIRFQARLTSYGYLVQDPYPAGLFGSRDIEQSTASSTTPTHAAPGEGEGAVGLASSDDASDALPPTAEPSSTSLAFAFRPMSPVADLRPSDDEWKLVVTKPARRVLVAQLIIGAAGYVAIMVVYILVISSAVTTFGQDVTWSQNYRSDVVSLNRTVIALEPTFSPASPNWTLITSACTRISAAVTQLDVVPQYPSVGPDKHLLEGVGLIGYAARFCTSTIAPKQQTAQLAPLAKVFNDGTDQLTTFLRQT